MVSTNKKLGAILRRHRLKAQLSQEKLADMANVHRTYISQIERGIKSPTINVLIRVIEQLETTLSEIATELEK